MIAGTPVYAQATPREKPWPPRRGGNGHRVLVCSPDELDPMSPAEAVLADADS